ncbi:MAG TPA: tetratricopeptide repeat protein [Longimicrobiales bacterium]
MNSRSLLLLTLVGLSAGACASGGTTTTESPRPSATADTPERTFPPGTAPSANTWTRSAEVHLGQAENTDDAAVRQSRFTSALEQARQSIANQPSNPLGYYQAGIALLGLGQYVEAGQMFDRAEEIYPRYQLETNTRRQQAWVNLYNQSVAALQQNNEDRAIELLEIADAIFQDRPEARTNLAVLYTNRGEYDQAVAWYQKTLETLRSDEVQYLPAARRAEYAELESDAIFNLAQVYTRIGRRADAIALYREYLADNPDDAAVKSQLALALTAEGQDEEAAQLFSEILNMEGLDDTDYYQIGIGLFNAGRFDEAVTAFERSIAANPFFRDAAFNLTQALMAQANAAEADGAAEAELVPVYERLVDISQALRGMDPFSRSAALVQANAYRMLADMTSGATSTEWRNRLVALLQEIEDMPFDVTMAQLSPAGAATIRFGAEVKNLKLQAGAPIALRVTLVGPGGTQLGTRDINVAAPAAESSVPVTADFQVQGEIAGWKYERL